MSVVSFQEAQANLAALMERATAGEEIVIARTGGPSVRLQLVDAPCPRGPREPGALKGQIYIAPDFDDLPEGFAEAFDIDEA